MARVMAAKKRDDNNNSLKFNIFHFDSEGADSLLNKFLLFLKNQNDALELIIIEVEERLDIIDMNKYENHKTVLNKAFKNINVILRSYNNQVSREFFSLKNQEKIDEYLTDINDQIIDLSNLLNGISSENHDVGMIYRGLFCLQSTNQYLMNEVNALLNNLNDETY